MRSTDINYRGHILLITPLTFSYHIAISEVLGSMGFAVTWWDDRASSATWYKLALRLFPKITTRLSDGEFSKRLKQIDSSSITHILVVKGEGLSKRMAFKLRDTFRSASMGFYLWDSVENAKNSQNIKAAFDSISTFDPVDAKSFNWHYRPLFWRKGSAIQNSIAHPEFDWCFIGTIHSDRHKVIHLLRQSSGKKYRSFIFAYFQSPLLLFVRKIFDRTLWLAPKQSLSTKPMSASDVAKVVDHSIAVLDVEHPLQRGFTMRTIETLLAEKKLVTTNTSILDSDLYHPSRVHVINRNSPEIPLAFLRSPFQPVDEVLRAYYSCEGWVKELLSIQDGARAEVENVLKA